jgi:hypothetical protein
MQICRKPPNIWENYNIQIYTSNKEKEGIGSDAHPWLAGKLGDELVVPGEQDDRGRHRGRASERKTLTLLQAL